MSARASVTASLWAVLILSGAAVAQTSAADGKPGATAKATAIFASGCFWCTEADFEKVPGVLEAESGYIGGRVPNPTYEQVSDGNTGHTEAVRIVYDPAKVNYQQLLDVYWRNVDPTVKDRQFCDVGNQYRSAVFYENDEQKRAAQASKAALEKSGRFAQIHTEITPASTFYPAEAYHQDYYKKNPIRYKYYRNGCGRDARLAELWGKK